jgi:hypothetical protein
VARCCDQLSGATVWLDRGQYSGELNAIFHNFRIYDAALSASQVATWLLPAPVLLSS